MKKIKIVLIIVMLFVLSGCTVNSNVTLNYDGKVTEEILLLNKSELFGNDAKEINTSLDDEIEYYNSVIDYREYEYEKIVEKDKSGVRVYKSYDNICSYFRDTAFNQYVYEHIKCIETEDYYEIESDTEHIPYCVDCAEWPILDDVNLILHLPIQASEHNADSVDKNVYTWHFDKETTNDKTIYIKINKNQLKENEVKQEKKNKILHSAKTIGIIVLIVSLLIVGYLIFRKLYKKYKQNKLDY